MRHTVAVCIAVLAASTPPAAAQQQVPEGCFVTVPVTVSPNPCRYVAKGDAAYAGVGTWRLEIVRRGQTLRLESETSPAHGAPGAIRSGDVVTVEATGVGSALEVVRTAAVDGVGPVDCDQAEYGSGGIPGSSTPNDPLFDRQWGLQQVHAPDAWRLARGRGAVVAVVDTGVDLGHPDLRRQLVDGVDLWESRPGGSPDCPGPQDEQYHGTEVAGVIAARTDNRIGIAGVAPAARLMPVRVRDSVDSTDFSRVGAGIRWATDHGSDVISLTGGVYVPFRPAPVVEEDIAEAIAYAWERGVVVVATAGNAALPWCQYPAASEHVICAAANDSDGHPASYSNLPLKLGSGIALRAPGGSRSGTCDAADDIWSTTLPGAPRVDACGDRGYGTDSGTTFATAHIAGVAALLAGRGLNNTEIVSCLQSSSTGSGRFDPIAGYGTVDALRATRCAMALRGGGRR